MNKTCVRCKKDLDISVFTSGDKILKTCQNCRIQPKVKCQYCDKELLNKSMKNHLEKKHNIVEDNLYIHEQPEMTDEQNKVIDTILEGNNVRVFAKAGTGKTTMALELSNRYYERYNRETVIITYNRLLCNDVSSKITEDHTKVFTYHSLCGKLYKQICRDDTSIRTCLTDPLKIKPHYGLIIIDEAQDMGKTHYDLINRVILESDNVKILIMGDPFQRLYENRGIYYTEAESYFNDITFVNLHLSISFRISHEMAEYINTNMNPNVLAEKYEFTDKEKQQISFWWKHGIKANPKRKAEPNSVKVVNGDRIKTTLENAYETYTPSQTIVIGRGVKSTKSPVGHLSEMIDVKYGEPKTVNSDTNRRDNRMRHYSTIEQCKGLEFDLVCLPDLSNFWLDKTNIFDNDRLRMFNLYYVALSRAKKELIICEKYYPDSRCCPSSVFCTHKDYVKSKDIDKPLLSCTVTSLVEFVPILNIDFYEKSLTQIGTDLCGNTNVIGQGTNYSVEISKYIGKALGNMILIRKEQFFDYLDYSLYPNKDISDFKEIKGWIDNAYLDKESSWVDVIKYTIAEDALASGFSYLWRQITDEIIENAINIEFLENCLINVNTFLENYQDIKGEMSISHETTISEYTKKYSPVIHGRCDFYADNCLIELKFSNNILANEHVEQALLYTAMLQENGEKVDHTYLYYANKGICYKLNLIIPFKEYINRILLRKCGVCYETYKESVIKKVVKQIVSKDLIAQPKINTICKAIKKNGQQCTYKTKNNNDYCGIHK